MSVDFKALGGLFRFRYINDVEDMDLDDLEEMSAELEEEYQGMKNDCKELKKELDKLREVIERKNPEERREKIKEKQKPAKEILNNMDIPYEVRMKHILKQYMQDQEKWEKMAVYAKHLEGEVIRLKNILIVNGYTDTGNPKDSNPMRVIYDLRTKVNQLKKKANKADALEEKLKVKYPKLKYDVGCFKKVIKSQKEYIEELQEILESNDVPYPPKVPINELEKEDIDTIDENAVRG